MHNDAFSSAPPTLPAHVLLSFDFWATNALLDACENLTNDQLDREFPMGLGTVRKSLTHIIGATRGWTDVLTRTDPPRPRLEHDSAHSIADLRALHAESSAEFARGAKEGSHDDILSRTRDGKQYHFTRGGILTHVTTHSVHHRAQVINMLRHLGVDPLPQSSVMQWMLAHPPA